MAGRRIEKELEPRAGIRRRTPQFLARAQVARGEELPAEKREARDLTRSRMPELEPRCQDGTTAWGKSD